MPTGTPDINPFLPQGIVTREELLAHASGRLSTEDARRVECHLEADPLLREAAEGLAQSGALDLGGRLDQYRPSSGRSMPYLHLLSALAVIGVAAWWLLELKAPARHEGVGSGHLADDRSPSPGQMDRPLAAVVIDGTVELPESLRIGHGHNERYARVTSTGPVSVDRGQGIDRMEPRVALQDPSGPELDRSTLRRQRPSRQLVYLHDLKVVHPKELHPNAATIELEELHVDASHVDQAARDAARAPKRMMDYLPYMDAALARFTANDHKGCLEELRFMLGQYPDDVNALFYAGLCCYNLGLYTHARDLLYRSATHPIDTFDEESLWYHALTLERSGEQAAAQEAFGKIAADSGFYADRARARLAQRP